MTGSTAPLYVVCSPSRCVGKTLLARLLTEFHVLDDRPVTAFDLADEGPQLTDYLPELATVADIGDTRGQMAFFDQLIEVADGAKVIDVSHRAFKRFFAIVREIGLFEEARRRSFEPLILFIADPEPQSVEAYATLRSSFADASLLPVRNQIEDIAALPDDGAASSNGLPASLDIPLLSFSLRALIDRQSFSFSEFWRITPANPADPLDDNLRGWIEGTFTQFRELERSLTGEATSIDLVPPRSRPRRSVSAQRRLRAAHPPAPRTGTDWDSSGAGSGSRDVPHEVLKFAPKKMRPAEEDMAEQTGDAIVARLQVAAGELRAAEARINQLETEIEHAENRAVRAEAWLQVIRQEIEQKLIAPIAADPPKPVT